MDRGRKRLEIADQLPADKRACSSSEYRGRKRPEIADQLPADKRACSSSEFPALLPPMSPPQARLHPPPLFRLLHLPSFPTVTWSPRPLAAEAEIRRTAPVNLTTTLIITSLEWDANVCKKLPFDCSYLVLQVVPTLCNILQYEDSKLVETAVTCLIRITDCFNNSSEILDELCKHGMIGNSLHLITVDGRTTLSQTAFVARDVENSLQLYSRMRRNGILVSCGTYEVLSAGLERAGRIYDARMYSKEKRTLQ